MKASRLSLLLVSYWLVAFLPIYAIPYVSPVRFMEIPLCTQTMVFNGIDDEACWSEAQSVSRFLNNGWTGNQDLSAWFKVCWDQDYLYFFVDITDDVNDSYDPSYSSDWMYDCAEVYLDLDTSNHPSSAYDDNTIQLRFHRGSASPYVAGRASPSEYLYDIEEKTGGNGWIAEIGIPWSAAMPSGSLPEDINSYVEHAIGFDVNISDSDNSDGDPAIGNRDVMAAWDEDGLDGTEDLAWNNTSVFGIVELLTSPPLPAIAYTQPVRTMEIPAREDRIVFDGVADETSWSESQDVTVFNHDGWTSTSDFDATFNLTWDMEYLYFFADITDNVEEDYAPGLADPWMFDCVEFFIDLDTVMGYTEYDEDAVQLRFHRGLGVIELSGRAPESNFIYHWENKPGNDGWIIESAIPWTCVMPTGYEPDDFNYYVNSMLGLDINFSDSDNSDGNPDVGNRDAQAAWDADLPDDSWDRSEDLAWNNTHVFGIVDLIGEPLPPDPEPIGLPYVKPLLELDVPVRNIEFTLDCNDHEVFWSYPQKLTIFNDADYTGEEDLSAYFRTAWDYDYLYLFASVTDDTDRSWVSGQGDPSVFDNLEVYFDLDTFSLETTYRSNSTAMLRFCRGNDVIQSTGRAENNEFEYTWANFEEGGGWKLEAAIPWTCALAAGSDPSDIADYMPAIGFDVTVNDLDAGTPSGRENLSQAAWDTEERGIGQDPLEDQAMTNTRMFGIANLSPYWLEFDETTGHGGILIYPNPACREIRIENLEDVQRIDIIDLKGSVIRSFISPPSLLQIDISPLTGGIYLAHITYIYGVSRTIRFAVE
jgi:hypothetical protein